jgi:hypothetical protein
MSYNLSRKYSFRYTSLMADYEQGISIIFFKAGLSVTETLVSVQKAYGNETLNRSNVFRWYSWFRDGRALADDDERGGRPKSTRTEVNIAAVADLVKNGRRIASRIITESFTTLQDCSSSDSERECGKEKVVCMFCSTLLDTWTKERSNHILPSHYFNARCRQKFL